MAADGARREELAESRLPRLLLVARGLTPPPLDPDEDWIMVPADERDVWARLRRLADQHDERRRRPELSGVVLRHDDRTVVLSPGDSALLQILLGRFGHLVTWDDIGAALWPGGDGTRKRAVDRVSRLRRRLAATGLVVHAIRGRGVLLDHEAVPS